MDTNSKDPNFSRRRALAMLTGGLTVIAGLDVFASENTVSTPTKWPLWSLQKNDYKILLTTETPPQKEDWHSARIEQLLDQCTDLWTETNNIYHSKQSDLINQYAIDAHKSLTNSLLPSDQARLRMGLEYCGLKMTDVEQYRPWFVASVLQEQFYQVAGWKGKSAREVLSNRASNRNIRQHSEFDQKDNVFAWFGDFTPLQDIQFLRYVLDEIQVGPEADASIFSNWAARRFEPAAFEVERYSKKYPDLYKKLTLERNKEWIPRFERMSQTQKTPLVIVGLYHIAGHSGVLSLAEQAGWKVSLI